MARTDTVDLPLPSPYERLGGAPALRKLVDAFYDAMDRDPAAADIRRMHQPDLGPIRDKLFDWLSGWSGGPPLYNARPDRACIMSTHAPYVIGPAERDQWLACMRGALDNVAPEPDVRALFETAFDRLADGLRNR
ncbi:MAG TPA: group II truncated hemoglobin [Caulobacter sp.]|nr:group II truncated hemoglobin [Caulobacter sp.]